jgi:hypothetical protein
MVFLSFLAKPIHLQLISEEDYKKLIKEMPAALDVLYGNTKGRFCTYRMKRILSFTKKIKDNDRIYQNKSIGKLL